MMMTKLAAKRAALAMWRFLRDNPDKGKQDYPKCLKWYAECALCEYFNDERGPCSVQCPLYPCVKSGEPYQIWSSTHNEEAKRKSASDIVKLIEAWKI